MQSPCCSTSHAASASSSSVGSSSRWRIHQLSFGPQHAPCRLNTAQATKGFGTGNPSTSAEDPMASLKSQDIEALEARIVSVRAVTSRASERVSNATMPISLSYCISYWLCHQLLLIKHPCALSCWQRPTGLFSNFSYAPISAPCPMPTAPII